jgi:hypothetical protein
MSVEYVKGFNQLSFGTIAQTAIGQYAINIKDH